MTTEPLDVAADGRHHVRPEARDLLLPAVLLAAAVGGVAWLVGVPAVSDVAFIVATVIALVPATISSAVRAWRREAGVDIVAVLAMVGALLLAEWFAGAIIAVMLTGGEALEERASRRASRDLTALLARAPRVAHRTGADGRLSDVPVEQVEVGDELVVKAGEVVPTDGVLRTAAAVLDESALTGEARPVEVQAGQLVRSGVVVSGGAIQLRATATAAGSTYAGIVRLVEQAATQKAPFTRMADRYATVFLWLTLVVAGGAWALSGEPVRALAVLVVATPCPLILAAPAAIVGGLSSASRRGIIVKGGAALEALARAEVVLLDKTGTITAGRPRVAQVIGLGDHTPDEVLRAAAALDQVSVHPFAPAIVAAAHRSDVDLELPTDVGEVLGAGIHGRLAGREVRVGRLDFVTPSVGAPTGPVRRLRRRATLEGSSPVYVALDGTLAGAILLTDPVRPESARAVRALRRTGIHTIAMVTGDRADVAELVADTVGIDRVLSERTPEDKVEAVREAQALGRTIVVGDGINDAPALATADVGIAMGARGATAASEAADVVLTVDRLEGVADAVGIARRARGIARQSAIAGMTLSAIGMGFAAVGLLTPVAGALAQEGIDLAVLLNALRAVRGPRTTRARTVPVRRQLLHDHRQLASGIDRLSRTAERLDVLDGATASAELEEVRRYLVDHLLPHELEEERELFPALAAAIDGEDPTASLARTHREIARLVRTYERLVDDLPPGGPDRDDVIDLQRTLWGLHAILTLHLALEDELFAEVAPEEPHEASPTEVEPTTVT